MLKAGVAHRGGEDGGARGYSDFGAGYYGTYKMTIPQAAAWGLFRNVKKVTIFYIPGKVWVLGIAHLAAVSVKFIFFYI